MAAGTFWNPERRRLEMRDALGNILQVFMVEGSDPSGLPPTVVPFSYVPPEVQDMVRRAAQGDPGAPAQIANSVSADNVLFAHLGKNPPGTTTTAAGTTVAIAQSPEMINARTNIALTAANAADAKAKLDLREQGLRNAYAAIGKGDQFPAWTPPQRAAQPGQAAPPPEPADYGFSREDLVALEQDPAYVQAFTNLGGVAAGIAIMARERALDQAEAQLGERKTDLDRFNAFKAAHESVGDLEAQKGDYIQAQQRAWAGKTHRITGTGGAHGVEWMSDPEPDLSGTGRYDRAIAKAQRERDEALAAYRPKEFEWEQKNRLATDKGRLQALAPHQWQSFFPDEAERKKLQSDAYGSEWPTFATGGVFGPQRSPTAPSLDGVQVPGAPAPSAPPPTVANAPAPSAGPAPTVAGAPAPTSGPTTVEAAQAAQAAADAAAREAALAASSATGAWGTGQLDEPNTPETAPPLYPGDRHSAAQVPTRQQLLRHETAQQLKAIQTSADAELRSIAQQGASIGAQLAQGMRELQDRQRQSADTFTQQMAALQERRTAQKAEFDVRIATAQQQQQNNLAGLAASQTEAAGRNPFQPQFLGQAFRPNEILRGLPPLPVRR